MSIFLALALLLQSAGGRQVDITIRDAQGLAVDGARITVTEKTTGSRKTAVSTSDKTRVDGLSTGEYEVRVEKEGFVAQTTSADLRSSNSAAVDVKLEVGGLSRNVVVSVSRTEQEIGNVPASVTLLSSEEIKASPAIAADDILRQIPTFSLFRRTSSLAAHPTAQGVSLRGVGPSGVSRTLVLVDGIPFNDPFGGWVYWTRIPMQSVRQIEVVESPNSSVYGNYALGGVMNIVTAPPEGATARYRQTAAGRQTWKEDFFVGFAGSHFGAAMEGTVLDTNGYYIVPALEGGVALRGPVDTRAAVNNENFNIKIDFQPSSRISSWARTGYFNEHRVNGKVGETNDSMWKFVSGGTQIRLASGDNIQANVFGNFERFHSLFLAITSPGGVSRSASRLTLRQAVPTKDTGGSVQWSRNIGKRNYLTVGGDWRWVDGDSTEDVMNNPPASVQTYRISGGTQKSEGFFIQDLMSITPKLQITLSARLDHWRNYDAHNLETSATTGLPTTTNFPSCDTSKSTPGCLASKKNTIPSPKVGVVYHVSEKVSVWTSASTGFRAPTLNELYRQFRVGTVLTLPNEKLGAERLYAWEGGVNVHPIDGMTWRSTAFVNRFNNPVSNVTQSVTPAQTTRKRQNLSKTRIWGVQSDVDYRLKTNWKFGVSYLYDIAKVRESLPDSTGTNLTGKVLPEVPRHRGTAEVSYSNPKYVTASASMQFTGGQYDDDINTLWLPYYPNLDINLMRKVGHNMEVFVGMQNVLDKTFYVQRGPTTVGSPRLVTGGLEISWNGR